MSPVALLLCLLTPKPLSSCLWAEWRESICLLQACVCKIGLLLSSDYHIYQYFVQVVPTEVRTYSNNVDTYQFAVTERVTIYSLDQCWVRNSQSEWAGAQAVLPGRERDLIFSVWRCHHKLCR